MADGVLEFASPDARAMQLLGGVPDLPTQLDFEPLKPRIYKGSPLQRWNEAQRAAGADPESIAFEAEQRALKAADGERWDASGTERRAESARSRAALLRHHAAKRRATKLQRTPAWADMAAIRAVYDRAQAITRETGIEHHVDHELPLQGELVSGLHVHNNLQVLTASENSKKRNRFEVTE